MDDRTIAAIEASDTDVLLRIVDEHCHARRWGELHTMRVYCREALVRGKQLWAIDEHIRYRLALEAPAEHAGPVVGEGPARWTLGPLPEVTASTHTWEEVAPHLPPGPERAMVAHERVTRGEDLRTAEFDHHILEVPAVLQPWEPAYPLAEYRADRAEFPTPPLPVMTPAGRPPGAPVTIEDEHTLEAVSALVTPWVEGSSGRSETRAVEGTALDAIAALGSPLIMIAPVPPSTAMAWMGWAAASGAAHGLRPGAAAGRFSAWWAAAALASTDWPPDPAELGEAISELEWFLWSDGSTEGWRLQLAVADPHDGLAWAISAVDTLQDPQRQAR
jgi:hypothetical protein